jgi:hypothetical protein
MISFSCPNCNRRLSAKEELTGRKVKCPQCGQPAQVPAGARSLLRLGHLEAFGEGGGTLGTLDRLAKADAAVGLQGDAAVWADSAGGFIHVAVPG